MEINIAPSWRKALEEEIDKNYFKNLMGFVAQEYQTKTIYPPAANIFSAFDYTSFDKVKVVIVGQDPYHGPNQANGLSFSVKKGVPFPPSLQNIFKELKDDVGIEIPISGDLSHWAQQGVLMLNATLTVEEGKAGSHQKKGWEQFTDAVIQQLAEKRENLVFILWGSYAQKKGANINRDKHFVIESAHPSPLSVYRGFWGSKPFSKTNQFLISKKIDPVKW